MSLQLHRNSPFHLLCSLSGRAAAAASVAGNPICKFKTDSSLSLGEVALNEPPDCSSCPRTLFQSWSLPGAGAFASLLSEANVSQDTCSTWELFSQLEVTAHEPCCGGSRDSLGRDFVTHLHWNLGPRQWCCSPATFFPVLQAGSSHLSPWAEIPFQLG